MNIIIIDDEAASIDALVSKLQYYNVSIEGTALSGTQGIGLIKKTEPDVVFLDV